MYQTYTVNGSDYYMLTAYFVNPGKFLFTIIKIAARNELWIDDNNENDSEFYISAFYIIL
jgi:hypothetical protein